MVYRTSGHKGPSPQRHTPTKECQRTVPSSFQPSPTIWGNHCGSDDRDYHTQPRKTIVTKKVATPLTSAVYQGPRHRDGVDMPDAGLHPHRESMHKQHTQSHGHRAVCPFGDNHTHNAQRPNDNRQEYNHSSANTLGPSHHSATTHQADDESKGRKQEGTSAKGSVLILTCVPLPHLVLPLSGCACSGTPTMATRGEARGHP